MRPAECGPRGLRLAPPSVAVCLALAGASVPAARAAEPACLRGVNLSGPEFGALPGRHGTDYAYPSARTIARFGALGLTAVRLPVRWERLQPRTAEPLDAAELLRLDAAVVAAKLAGMRTVIDLHNFAYHGRDRIGTGAATRAAFADVWRRLAAHFRSEPAVAFGLMNEPYDIPAAEWLPAANAAVAAIRDVGARQLVLVPGTLWTGVHSWEADTPLGNNARTMPGLVDPGENAAYDVHQYLDADFSGGSGACPRGADALAAVERLTGWLLRNRARAYLGEVGASAQAGCPEHLAAILAHVNAHPAQWVGWAAWGAGDWWPPSYHFRIEPGAGPLSAVIEAAARAAPRCGGRP
ncbi:Endoglucanase [Methylobacterium hispanicum]|jgi:endoglucanase|uniref:Endoglucanase n=2 Tax=Methylobacterium hispanicum TaxID=270350 RepID=A0AAV4ZU45_9HYPH|nr:MULTISPECIES: glycoside hydrolase family 5 protein [Methylobacterium]GJD91674.1 Endoglucanase [Methylobacterium hispanicum]